MSLKEVIEEYKKVKLAMSQTNIHIENNSGIIAINSKFDDVAQKINHAPSLSDSKREDLIELFSQLKDSVKNVPDSHHTEANVMVEIAENLTEELGRQEPRKSMLKISASGLIEAAKYIVSVAPKSLEIATKIGEFLAGL